MAKSKKIETRTKSAGPTQSPLIDTGLAASAAARLIKAKVSPTGADSGSQTQSASFKQLKDGINKPHASGVTNMLHQTAGPESKKTPPPFGHNKQVGHNQTFGADVNRTGVPRRTAG